MSEKPTEVDMAMTQRKGRDAAGSRHLTGHDRGEPPAATTRKKNWN